MATKSTKMHNSLLLKGLVLLLSCVLCFESVFLLAQLVQNDSAGYDFFSSTEDTIIGNGRTKYAKQIQSDIGAAVDLASKYQTLDESKIEETDYYIEGINQRKKEVSGEEVLKRKKEKIDTMAVSSYDAEEGEVYYEYPSAEANGVSIIRVTEADQSIADEENNGLMERSGKQYYKGYPLDKVQVKEDDINAQDNSAYQEAIRGFQFSYKNKFRDMKILLSEQKSFRYFILDKETGKTYTNMQGVSTVREAAKTDMSGFAILTEDKTMAVSKELSSVFEKTYEYYRTGGTYDISTAENSSPYLFAAGVYETFVGQLDPSRYDTYFQVPLQFNEAAENDPYYRLYMEYEDAKAESMRILAAFLTCGVLWLLTVLFLMIIAGKKQEDGSIQLAKIDYLPASLHVLASGIMIALLIMAGLRSANYMVELDRNYAGANVLPWKLLCAALAVLINLFLIEWGSSLVRQIRGHGFVKNSLTYNLFSKDGRCRTLSSKFVSYCKGVFPVKDKKVKKKLITVMVLYFVFVVLLSIAGWWVGTLLIILASVLLAAYIAHLLQDIQTIDDALAEAEKGSYDYQLQPEKMTDAMKPLGQKVGNLTNGVKLAVETAVKNERQKTDLITGVSHDLKTPLTSIINYTELLKTCNIQDPQAKQYISVLEEKSAALKKLVEDLLEASKVSSGNLEVHLEKINLSELLEEVYGEYEEPLQEKGLLLKLDTPSAPVYVKADGQKVYRVLENLFSNVQKYSLDNTRVYIDLKQEEKTAMVAVKNISKEEMNYDPAELTERFFRGDRSRTTEGSGLGLSIAESLTTAQNGTFTISIDGDLFKVTIRLPLAE